MRFPEFSGEWERKRIRELFAINVGGDIDKKDVNPICTEHFKYPIIANALSNDGIYGYTSVYKDKAPCITVTGRGDIGKAKYRDTPLYPIVRLLVLHSLGDVDCLFGEYAINHIRIYEESTGVPQLTAPQLGAYHIKYPSSEEQMKIGAFLSLLDKRISTQNKIIEDLKTLRLATNDYLQKHFEPAFNLSFAELGTDFGGLSGKSADDFGTGYPYITYMGVYSKNFVTEADCSLVTILPNETQSKVQKGDVLFTLSSETPEEVCYGSVYVGNVKEVYLNSFCFGVHITNSNVYSPYLAYFVNSTLFRKAVFPLAQGSTRFNLQKSDFLKKKFAFPSKEKQIEIYNTLQALENKLQIEIALLDKYRVQKQYFLQQMFI